MRPLLGASMALTIVIADDYPDYRTLVRLLVGPLSAAVVVGEAADGNEALALVLLERPPTW